MTYLEWLKKEGYELDNGSQAFDVEELSWSRAAKYGSPKCEVNGLIKIQVSKVGERFVMSIVAKAKNYWSNLQVYDIDEDFLIKRGRATEHRLVAAWMELSA